MWVNFSLFKKSICISWNRTHIVSITYTALSTTSIPLAVDLIRVFSHVGCEGNRWFFISISSLSSYHSFIVRRNTLYQYNLLWRAQTVHNDVFTETVWNVLGKSFVSLGLSSDCCPGLFFFLLTYTSDKASFDKTLTAWIEFKISATLFIASVMFQFLITVTGRFCSISCKQ